MESDPATTRANIAQFSLEMDESAFDSKYLLIDGGAFDTMETYRAAQVAARKTIEKGNIVALTLFHVEKLGAQTAIPAELFCNASESKGKRTSLLSKS